VVLRKEIGKVREETMILIKGFEDYKEDQKKEREVDRNVDMEEKLCLIRGLREVADMGDGSVDVDVGAELEQKFEGLGIDLRGIDYNDAVSENSEDTERRFDKICPCGKDDDNGEDAQDEVAEEPRIADQESSPKAEDPMALEHSTEEVRQFPLMNRKKASSFSYSRPTKTDDRPSRKSIYELE